MEDNNKTWQPRILILCTQPYHPMVQSRALDSYFHFWDRDNLYQIFSDARTPIKGLCASLYQITDWQLVQRWKKKNAEVGRVFNYSELPDEWEAEVLPTLKKAKKWKSNGLYRWARKTLWKKRFWNTDKLNRWIEETVKPDAIFFCFSPDFFLLDIAEYISNKWKIPMFLSITDDLYFQDHFSLSPFYWLYRAWYKHRIRKLMKRSVFGVFESEKIKRKYCDTFHIPGCVQYIASSLPNVAKVDAPSSILTARYLGNIEYGRFESLCQVADAFLKAGKDIKVEVYSSSYPEIVNKKHPANLVVKKPVSYDEALKLMSTADLLLLVEGTKKKDQRDTAYSLSTKVGDTLGSGRLVLAYGGAETGALSFLKEKDACLCANNLDELASIICSLDNLNKEAVIEKSLRVAKECFDLNVQAKKWLEEATSLLKKG